MYFCFVPFADILRRQAVCFQLSVPLADSPRICCTYDPLRRGVLPWISAGMSGSDRAVVAFSALGNSDVQGLERQLSG